MKMTKRLSIFLLAAGLAACLAGCSREVLVTQGKSLGVKEVYPAAGDFSAFINTEGVWSVSSPEAWIHVPGGLFKDPGAVIVSYDSNESVVGAPLKTYDGAAADTLYIRQQGIEPYISLEDTAVSASGGSCYIPLYTNLTGAQRGSISCTSDAGWISGVSLGPDCRGLVISVAPGSGREGRISVSFKDEWGIETVASCKIIQREGGQ